MTLAGFRWRPALLAATIAVFAGLTLWPAADAGARAGGGYSSSGGSRSSGGGYSGGYRSSGSYSRSSFGGSSYPGRSGKPGPPLKPIDLIIPLGGVGIVFAGIAGSVVLQARKAEKQRLAHIEARKAHHAIVNHIAGRDERWATDYLRARVEEVYYQVQQAWTERNQDLAKDAMSRRLYADHKRQTDAMIRNGVRNMLDDIRFLRCEIVHVADRKGTRNDVFWAEVHGRICDGMVVADPARFEAYLNSSAYDPKSPEHLKFALRPVLETKFAELWKFVRDEDGDWVLDQIEQELAARAQLGPSFSEEMASA